MDKTTRRHHTPEQKVRILRLHLLEGKPISEICEAEGIHPTLFYQWQKTFFEKGTAAFENGRSPSRGLVQNERKLEALESKLRRKDVSAIVQKWNFVCVQKWTEFFGRE